MIVSGGKINVYLAGAPLFGNWLGKSYGAGWLGNAVIEGLVRQWFVSADEAQTFVLQKVSETWMKK